MSPGLLADSSWYPSSILRGGRTKIFNYDVHRVTIGRTISPLLLLQIKCNEFLVSKYAGCITRVAAELLFHGANGVAFKRLDLCDIRAKIRQQSSAKRSSYRGASSRTRSPSAHEFGAVSGIVNLRFSTHCHMFLGLWCDVAQEANGVSISPYWRVRQAAPDPDKRYHLYLAPLVIKRP